MRALITIIAVLVLSGPSLAQDNDAWALATTEQAPETLEGGKLTVPLSNPGKPGKLIVNLLYGSIRVLGYDGKEVEIEVSAQKSTHANKNNNCNCPDEAKSGQNDPSTEGLKKIPNNSIGLEAIEDDNQVTVRNTVLNRYLDLVIKVPKKFSVKLNSTNTNNAFRLALVNPKLAETFLRMRGNSPNPMPNPPDAWSYSSSTNGQSGQEGQRTGIMVENLSGEVEIGCTNGNVILSELSGAAVVNTVNGQIKAIFKNVSASNMSFTTLNGSIDVTLPATLKATAKIKSDQGEIFTDFDMEMVREQPQVEKKGGGKVYRVSVDNSVVGKINGGGPDLVFKNMSGNIYIRKQK
jgi:hypothetical protein